MSDWLNALDQKPEENQLVLALCENTDDYVLAMYSPDSGWTYEYDGSLAGMKIDVSHWISLPKKPVR